MSPQQHTVNHALQLRSPPSSEQASSYSAVKNCTIQEPHPPAALVPTLLHPPVARATCMAQWPMRVLLLPSVARSRLEFQAATAANLHHLLLLSLCSVSSYSERARVYCPSDFRGARLEPMGIENVLASSGSKQCTIFGHLPHYWCCGRKLSQLLMSMEGIVNE